MNKLFHSAGIILLVVLLVLSLTACGQRSAEPEVVTQTDTENKEIVVETPPPSPTPTPTPTPSVPPVAVTTVPMPMPSVSPTIGVTTTPEPENSDGTGTDSATASPAVSASPSPSASPTPVYSQEAYFASTIQPDGYTVPANAVPGYVNANGVIVRAGPSASAVILGTCEIGTYVDILTTENGWTEVIVGGTTGYIRSEYLTRGSYSGTPQYVGRQDGSSIVIIPELNTNVPTVTGNANDTWNPALGIMPD